MSEHLHLLPFSLRGTCCQCGKKAVELTYANLGASPATLALRDCAPAIDVQSAAAAATNAAYAAAAEWQQAIATLRDLLGMAVTP